MAAMRIAYVGNFRAPHSTENEVRKALEYLGHEVLQHQEDHQDWWRLPFEARDEGADLVLWTHTHGYADESKHDACWQALLRLERLGIPTVGYHLDRWWGLERQRQVETEPFFRCDLVVTADGDPRNPWVEHGINHVWMPPAIGHEEVGRGTPRDYFNAEVAFVGGWANYGHGAIWPWRKQLIHWLQMNYGDRLGLWPIQGEPAVRGPALRDLYASVKVVIGDSCLAGGATHYWSDRIPETLGRGGLLIHPDVPGLWDHYPADRVPGTWACLPWVFDLGDFDGLRDTIDAALALDDDDRRALTDEGINWVREHHTYVQRMEQVLTMMGEL